MAVTLGSNVTDKVTGFTGIATSRIQYLNGCVRIGVQPPVKDNKIEDAVFIDEQQLDETSTVKSGGPYPAPSQRAVPRT